MNVESLNLNALVVFTVLARTRSFAAAATQLGTQKSTVSRQLAQLEATLKLRLVQRTPRKWALTEAGEAFLAQCHAVVAAAESALAAVTPLGATPSGLLRVASPVAFGETFLVPVIDRLLTELPSLSISVSLTDRPIELVDDQIDVAVRVGRLPDSGLVVRKLASLTPVACASPSYLERRDRPASPRDLTLHDCIPWNAREPSGEWRFRWDDEVVEVQVRGRVSGDNVQVQRALAIAGYGVALLPRYLVLPDFADGRLVELFPGAAIPFANALVVYPSGQHLAPKVRAFVDALAASVGPTL
jgi:DNA-binding transcriptional LysR family regulator